MSKNNLCPLLNCSEYPEVVCDTCYNKIEGKVALALGKAWHPEHFTCFKCNEQILVDEFYQHRGRPYCEQCYADEYLEKCDACGQPIKESVVLALEKTFHPEHFVCKSCQVNLTNHTFFEKDTGAYCQDCFLEHIAPKCVACNKPIKERSIMAMNKKWHPHCFKCSICHNAIEVGLFDIKDDKPVCPDCARKNKTLSRHSIGPARSLITEPQLSEKRKEEMNSFLKARKRRLQTD